MDMTNKTPQIPRMIQPVTHVDAFVTEDFLSSRALIDRVIVDLPLVFD